MSRPALSTMCRRCQTHALTTSRASRTTSIATKTTRSFSSSPSTPALDDKTVFQRALNPHHRVLTQPTSKPNANSNTPNNNNNNTNSNSNSTLESLVQGAHNEASTRPSSGVTEDEPYHLNIYAHRHNMHITFTEPGGNPIISYSAGNIGLKKAQRGSFDAAYQLSTYTMRKMAERQWRIGGKAMTVNKMLTLSEPEVRERGIEVILRGFGVGREAFQKALLGNEGKVIKPLIKKVTDSTRLKFGGTRSPQVRRLG